VETVASLQKRVRDPRAGYRQTLDVLKAAKVGCVLGWGGGHGQCVPRVVGCAQGRVR